MRSEIPIPSADQRTTTTTKMHGEFFYEDMNSSIYGMNMSEVSPITAPIPFLDDDNTLVDADEIQELRQLFNDTIEPEIIAKDFFLKNQQISLELKSIQEIEDYFYDALGFSKEQREEVRNYNVVLEYVNYKNLKTPEEIEQFKEYGLQQIKTALMERNSAAISVVEYAIGKDGKIYNSLFPKEPFEVVLQRGIAYREKQGSKDLPREYAEFEGWKQACTALMDPTTPIGTKAIIISGPGTAEGSLYKDNFIDIYRNVKDSITGKISIKITRFASGLSFKQYFNKVKDLNPNYFTDHFDESQIPDNSLLEKTFLGNPIWINSAVDSRSEYEIIDQHFDIRKTAMKTEDANNVWERTYDVAKHFLDTAICSKTLNPKLIAKLWNALLVKNDLEAAEIRKNEKFESNMLKPERQFKNIYEEIAWLGNQRVETIMAACGVSTGFDFNKNGKGDSFLTKSPLDVLSNSVAKFGLDKDDMGPLKFKCPECKYENTRPYGKLIEKCQNPDPDGCKNRTAVACKNE